VNAAQYLDDTVRVWLGLRADAPVDVPQLPEPLARRVLRSEEYEQPHRDQWGCFEYSFAESFRRGTLWEPEIDRWLADRRRELAERVELEPLWPDGREFGVCMSHDVDLISRVSTPAQAFRSLRTALADRPSTPRGRIVRLARPGVRAARALYNGISRAPAADTLERSVELERERGVTASYFFTVYPGGDASRFDCLYDFEDACVFRGEHARVRDVLRTLRSEGFDVGLHGSYNSALADGMLARERSALEAAVGADVTTTRQHFLHWDIRATPHRQVRAGLRADSSIGFNRNLGYRAGTSLPFRFFDVEGEKRLDLLEVPLLVHDGALLRTDALELDVPLARDVIRQFVDTAAETHGLATLIFHPNNLEHEEYLDLFRYSLDYGVERGAWFASLRDVDEWWRAREERVLRP
jgi:hypothetical protein